MLIFLFGGDFIKKNNNKSRLLKKAILGSSAGMIVMFMVILIPVLMVLDFFGANITDDYVENNMDYADQYKSTLNKALKNGYGYVPLNRILYFYLENDQLSFYDIYVDNIDTDTNKMKTISEVCELQKYRNYDVCRDLDSSNQIDEEQNKPFNSPIDFSKATVTSFFMEERIVFGESDVHTAWDLAAGNQTPVYATCDGTVTQVSFTQNENVTNTSAGGGNQIKIKCEIDDEVTYTVWYAHLYPGSAKVKEGDQVKAGDELAGVGTTGYSTGPHLHYQVQFDGSNIDGMSLIDFSEKTPSYKPNINNGLDHDQYLNLNINNKNKP